MDLWHRVGGYFRFENMDNIIAKLFFHKKEKLRKSALCFLLVLQTVSIASGLYAAETALKDWQKDLLAELKQLHDNGSSQKKLGFAEYTSGLRSRSPQQLLQVVEERITLRPYRGSMVDPLAALMGGSTNSLDRARLLSALLARANYDNRIVYQPVEPGKASTDYPSRTPAPLQPLNLELYKTTQGEVQTLAPGLWHRLCEEALDCEDWLTSLQADHTEQHVYWVQVQQQGEWRNLLPRGSRLAPSALSQAKKLDGKTLAGLRWTITLKVTNTYAGGTTRAVLEVSLPAAELHGQPISYDNIPDAKLSGFQPRLSIGDRPAHEGTLFNLNHSGQKLVNQQLHIIIKGPTEVRKYSRTLAVPFAQAKGLEMVTRGAIAISTGPFWNELTEELLERDLHRLANLLYAAPDQRDPAPLNLTSFSALSLLKLSRQLSGQVGLTSPGLLAYQARPAIILMRTYPESTGGQVELFKSFDIVDPGHGFVCDACVPQVTMKAAMEQSIIDGMLEDWLASGDGENNSSHKLGIGLLLAGTSIGSSHPNDPSWLDEYNGARAVYRLGITPTGVVGWRLDPGPQVVPLLPGGMGGVTSNIAKEGAKSGISPIIAAMIRHATTKCGASDIGGSIILALAGAPMTGPLLSGIVGHMCRVAEAYNKAADVLNCLEFMGNDCSASDKAKELDNMLNSLGEQLAIDLALAQALDILVGGAFEVIAPTVKGALRGAYDKVANIKVPRKPKPIADSTAAPHAPQPKRMAELKCSFHGRTLVLTDRGYVAIRDIRQAEDMVYSRDFKTGDVAWKPVLAHYKNRYDETVHVRIEDLTNRAVHTILSNRFHPFFVGIRPFKRHLTGAQRSHSVRNHIAGMWVDAEHLRPGQWLLNAEGGWSEVVNVSIEPQVLTAYNLNVADFHTFFVKGSADKENVAPIWVHNNCFDELPNGSNRLIDSYTRYGQPRYETPDGRVYYQGQDGRYYLESKYPPSPPPTITKPTKAPSEIAEPRGRRTQIREEDDFETQRSLRRENEAADILARKGYEIEQNPHVPGDRNPDYRIDGQIFDAYAPSKGATVNKIWGHAGDKVRAEQADGIVVVLEDNKFIKTRNLRDYFRRNPIDGLRQVLAIKNGKVLEIYP